MIAKQLLMIRIDFWVLPWSNSIDTTINLHLQVNNLKNFINMLGKRIKIITMHLQLIGVLTTMPKFKDRMINLGRIWINKLNNGIIMYSRKMQRDGDVFFIKLLLLSANNPQFLSNFSSSLKKNSQQVLLFFQSFY